jgi:hypothetical protein
MRTGDDFDRVLVSWFEAEATADGAATLLEATLDRTERLRPRAAWVVSLRDRAVRPWPPTESRVRTRLVYAALVAAIAAALAIGAALVVGQKTVMPAPPRACVGDPPTLCGYGAGVWTSAAFLPGLSLTLPNDRWYVRDLANRLELKTPPMNSAVQFQLDPVPFPAPAQPGSVDTGTVASLTDFIGRQPNLIVSNVGEQRTSRGIAMTTVDLKAADPRTCVKLFVPRARPDETNVVMVCHYAQRLHLVDLGGGHALSILLFAYDSQPATVERLDAGFAPILDSLRPPASFAP